LVSYLVALHVCENVCKLIFILSTPLRLRYSVDYQSFFPTESDLKKVKEDDCVVFQENLMDSEKAYGYLHVRAGSEKQVADIINTAFPEIESYAISQTKHKSCRGVRSYSTNIMVPGYILFRTYQGMQVSQLRALAPVFSILTYDDNQWPLRGDDLFCAKWLFNHDGAIGISVVFIEGDEIKVIDGPLKDVQGKIIRIDKRNRNALVALGLHQKTCKNVWLAFEYLDKLGVQKLQASTA